MGLGRIIGVGPTQLDKSKASSYKEKENFFHIITSDDRPDSKMKLVGNIFCSECGGELVMMDKDNDEPG
ncbi:MAG: hypothetical protein ISS66_03120 [Desulfobacteraceae bacterium]|nr:hypothetical protein [Desulfobacteraceae bacterium]